MKNKLFQKASSLFVGALVRSSILMAVLLIAASSCFAAEDPNPEIRGRRSDPLVGTWEWQATYSQVAPGFPAKFGGSEIFNSDGTMLVVTNLPGVTIGAGSWKPTGFDRYSLTVTFYRTDPRFPLMLPDTINVNLRLVDLDTYTTADVLMPLDPSGQPLFDPSCPGAGGLCAFNGTVQGKRQAFANFNTLLP